METWMYIAIAGGAILLLALLFFIAKRLKKRKKAKAVKVVNKEVKQQAKVEEPKDDGIIYDEDASVDLSKVKKTEDKQEEPNTFMQEDYDYEEDLDEMEEQRYREFMERHMRGNQKSQKKEVDDFEKFRNEYCYSKMLTDKQLTTEIIAGLPEDIRSVVFNETFKKINLDDIDIKL